MPMTREGAPHHWAGDVLKPEHLTVSGHPRARCRLASAGHCHHVGGLASPSTASGLPRQRLAPASFHANRWPTAPTPPRRSPHLLRSPPSKRPAGARHGTPSGPTSGDTDTPTHAPAQGAQASPAGKASGVPRGTDKGQPGGSRVGGVGGTYNLKGWESVRNVLEFSFPVCTDHRWEGLGGWGQCGRSPVAPGEPRSAGRSRPVSDATGGVRTLRPGGQRA